MSVSDVETDRLTLIEEKLDRVLAQQQEIADTLQNAYAALSKAQAYLPALSMMLPGNGQ